MLKSLLDYFSLCVDNNDEENVLDLWSTNKN